MQQLLQEVKTCCTLATKFPQTTLLLHHGRNVEDHVVHIRCNDDCLHVSKSTAQHSNHVFPPTQCLQNSCLLVWLFEFRLPSKTHVCDNPYQLKNEDSLPLDLYIY